MTEQEMHALLEAQGFAKEHNGGGTFIYRKGRLIVSGYDGDLPSDHWLMIGLYADWENDGDSCFWSIADDTAEWPDCGPALVFGEAMAQAIQRTLAFEFAVQLRQEIGPDNWHAMRAKNGKGDYVAACASHDYCDANMVMDSAFTAIMGREFMPDCEAPTDDDMALVNAAWSIAKREAFTA